jgi:hypothetical protein
MATVAFAETANNAFTYLADATITDSITTINVDSATALGLNDSTTLAYLTIISASSYGKSPLTAPETLEVVRVTAVSTNALTVARGIDGTSGVAFVQGDVIEVRNNAANLIDVQNALTDGTDELAIGGLTVTNDVIATGDIQTGAWLNLGVPSEVTINASGTLNTSQTRHTVDTYLGASTDDLVNITARTDGDILILTAESGSRDIVLVDTGNIRLAGAVDFTLDTRIATITLMYQSTTSAWVEISRSANTT